MKTTSFHENCRFSCDFKLEDHLQGMVPSMFCINWTYYCSMNINTLKLFIIFSRGVLHSSCKMTAKHVSFKKSTPILVLYRESNIIRRLIVIETNLHCTRNRAHTCMSRDSLHKNIMLFNQQ